ncbi:leader peptidase (prepilin peptidase) / N-methyltransferase [Gracilibacillus ureilyticus]|uniref:Leader peptidase (Prepilin peptidase) / N-methyltransferase n=1 Tax=Gracilibacillus ureilyticus TaxID=531814 RepID=A0A1H9MTS9_9BACI|nr:A24 family peptidase [Gracilibacillus ureilyticus]SER27092.1 leader peptidase (prepilin peptidase) / N-methyltransferase [Gracilibacillus ureilyticus]
MELYYQIAFFIFGMVFGSFCNVIGIRVPLNKLFESQRSHCPFCNKTLHWYELIPVLSYVFLSGKCKLCKTRLSMIYPIMELLTGFLFTFSFSVHGFTLELIVALTLSSLGVILIVTDLCYMLIPNKIMLFFLPIFLILRIFLPLDPWWSSLLGSFIGFVFIMLIILISKGGMGGGDMKLFALLGIVLGYQGILLTFLFSTLLATVVSILLILLKKINRKYPIPFGPYICGSALITYFYGNDIINWYITSLY